ncbi:MAG: glycoside hydrolase family 25 [Clostridiales bacterium]|nr:glycoside hydrolase family 25 [Clostridiales bacterium]
MNKRYAAILLIAAAVLGGCSRKEADKQAETSAAETTAEVSGNKETEISASESEASDSSAAETAAEDKAPFFLEARSKITLKAGDRLDINKYFSYIDDYDPEPKFAFDGQMDTTTPGTYNVKAVVTDNAGNSVSKDVTLNIVTEYPQGGGSSGTKQKKTIPYADFISKYKTDKIVPGIDVSKWQGDIDFNKVKSAGCEFVLMRAAIYTKGEFNKDSKFDANIKKAKAAGLKVGVYIFTDVNNKEDLLKATDKLINDILKKESLDFPIVFDWESWSGFQKYKMSMKDINDLFVTFCERVEQDGYEGMLYGSKNKLESVWKDSGHKVWLAHYAEQTDYAGPYMLWQVNEIGRISGIQGDVDLDLWYLE